MFKKKYINITTNNEQLLDQFCLQNRIARIRGVIHVVAKILWKSIYARIVYDYNLEFT